MSKIVIREIESSDNEQIAKVVRQVLTDFEVPKEGSAYSDASLNDMAKAYSIERSIYYVVEADGLVLGGGGIAPLDNYEGNVCELQKMYLLDAARGKGVGKKLIIQCLQKAKEFGFDGCYLETMPNMRVAQNIYNHLGFEYLDNPMGDTGHCACPVWMYKKF